MNADTIMTLINQSLFPIACVIGMALYIKEQQAKSTELLAELKASIDALRVLIDSKLQ